MESTTDFEKRFRGMTYRLSQMTDGRRNNVCDELIYEINTEIYKKSTLNLLVYANRIVQLLSLGIYASAIKETQSIPTVEQLEMFLINPEAFANDCLDKCVGGIEND